MLDIKANMIPASRPFLVLGFGQFGHCVSSMLEGKDRTGVLSCVTSVRYATQMSEGPKNDMVVLVCDARDSALVEQAITRAKDFRKNGNYVLAILRVSRSENARFPHIDYCTQEFDAYIEVSRHRSANYCAGLVLDVTGMLSARQLASVDFNDIRSVWNNSAPLICSIGYGAGPNRAEIAVRKALRSISETDDWSSKIVGMYVIVSAGRSLTLSETRAATNIPRSLDVGEDVYCYLGAYSDDSHGTRVRVTILGGCTPPSL
ncbi:hypothetical protein [Paraburkholderia caribensis]|uniref:hypothetical protein n=1 Tax=Paraburkholderia caribensis TaxID=75105 RepID=UPI00078EDAF7|nr:hypothetical protein [Paraburkholderia caribensis]AMV48260.1 hypothetical protein ATN79_47210 [Paraburkholderia caribensis]